MMLQSALEGRLAAHVTGQPDALRVEAGRNGERTAFVARHGRNKLKELPQRVPASAMDYTSRGADFLVRVTGRILLKEVDEPAFPLESCQEHQSGCVSFFRGRRCFCPGRR